ncbi:MAG: leucine-rich repeat domain-containing protein, partial [Clostridia bacterium]|nr:leucine-rich repeat domain-containing protein [Clostridia bacterium]
MKHKLLVSLLALATASIAAVGFTACGESNNQLKLSYELKDNTYTVKGTSSVPDGEYAIEIPSTYQDLPVTEIAFEAFKGHDGATSVTIPESVTKILRNAFYNCKDLKTINLPDSLTSISPEAFFGTAYYENASNWTSGVLYIGNHLIKAKDTITGSYSVKAGTLCIAYEAFYNCTALTGVTISNSVTTIGASAFKGCSGLTSVTIPGSVNLIDFGAFSGCSGLTSVTISNGAKSIGKMAFEKCNALTSVSLPNSITYIGNGAFSVSDVYYAGTIQEWNNIEKDSNCISASHYTIHCSDGDTN